MAISPEHDHGKRTLRHLDPSEPGQDKKRDEEDARHHRATHTQPHLPHQPQYTTTGATRHHPHTQPESHELNADHGTHKDRPRPGKIAKKERSL